MDEKFVEMSTEDMIGKLQVEMRRKIKQTKGSIIKGGRVGERSSSSSCVFPPAFLFP